MKIVRLCVLACLAAMMAGCGQKGPLVLPDTPRHKKVVPAPRAPASGAHTPAGTTGDRYTEHPCVEPVGQRLEALIGMPA